ncbi:DegV family protein [Bacillus thermotolerans]|uniref:DegV family protein n=1 Tax=Bacillus thermotolerans TaxID=1221996 RepID=A0A0F5I692_BACTR|nr:DegV family protein [Bacillus thermotolerans]KKB35965.1 DegV family protein [Bacillus thermotolerans]KKB41144.1 DegV family protein [Bacillus thermotolerans]KKB43006.1 DegV family protein [Bacillus thermotolerans]
MRTAIVTDSTSYIPKELREELNIHMIPLSVIIDQKTYREELDMTEEEFYERVRMMDELPKTTQPPIGEFMKLYQRLSKEYDAVIGIYLSSGISGTYQTSIAAGELVKEIDVYSFDSEISCMPQGFFAIRAAELAREGKEPEEILNELEAMKPSMRAYFIVDDLNHLKRGGRLNGAQALIGGLLQVKPLLHFVDKVIVPFEKVRTSKKALKRVADLFAEDYEKGEPLKGSIIHANCEEAAQRWLEELQARFPNAELELSHFGPVIGTHLGEGALGFGWIKKADK